MSSIFHGNVEWVEVVKIWCHILHVGMGSVGMGSALDLGHFSFLARTRLPCKARAGRFHG